MLKGNWRASKLMGLDVYNEANEKLGDINELILDKNGKVMPWSSASAASSAWASTTSPCPWTS